MAGMTSVAATYPLDLVRTRMAGRLATVCVCVCVCVRERERREVGGFGGFGGGGETALARVRVSE